MDAITVAVSKYIHMRGISIRKLAGKTRISYKALYPSLRANPERKLRADEFMRICECLGASPDTFSSQIAPGK